MCPTELRPEGELGSPHRGLLIVALVLLLVLGGMLVWAILDLRNMSL
jgi:hypothetical protein